MGEGMGVALGGRSEVLCRVEEEEGRRWATVVARQVKGSKGRKKKNGAKCMWARYDMNGSNG